MCLIVTSEVGSILSDVEIITAWRANPDGWGLAYHTPRGIQVRKGFTLKSALRANRDAEGCAYVLHFRVATHGDISIRNCHPWRVTHPVVGDMWMAHNGIISTVPVHNPDLSDSGNFALELSEMFALWPEWFESDAWIADVGAIVGPSNKLAFLDEAGRVHIANRVEGHDYSPEIWISNRLSVDPLPIDTLWGRYRFTCSSFPSDPMPRYHHTSTPVCDFCYTPAARLYWQDGYDLCVDCYDHTRREVASVHR